MVLILSTNLVSSVSSQTTLQKNKQDNRIYLHGIGKFNISNEDIIVSGKILIGFRGTKLLINEQIIIKEEDIIFIIASKHFLQSIIRV